MSFSGFRGELDEWHHRQITFLPGCNKSYVKCSEFHTEQRKKKKKRERDCTLVRWGGDSSKVSSCLFILFVYWAGTSVWVISCPIPGRESAFPSARRGRYGDGVTLKSGILYKSQAGGSPGDQVTPRQEPNKQRIVSRPYKAQMYSSSWLTDAYMRSHKGGAHWKTHTSLTVTFLRGSSSADDYLSYRLLCWANPCCPPPPRSIVSFAHPFHACS